MRNGKIKVDELKVLIIDRLKVIRNESLLSIAEHPNFKDKVRGDKVYGAEYNGKKANIIFLTGTNEDFVNAIEELKEEGMIEIKPLDILSSALDGFIYDMPIAKKIRVYAEPHWMPVELILKR